MCEVQFAHVDTVRYSSSLSTAVLPSKIHESITCMHIYNGDLYATFYDPELPMLDLVCQSSLGA